MTLHNDFKQLWLLLWKNFRLQLRSPIGLLIEILTPALFAIILLPIRTIVKSETFNTTTTYYPFSPIYFPVFPGITQIAYSPNDVDLANRIMNQVGLKFSFTPIGFKDEDEMVAFASNSSTTCLGGVSFLNTEIDNFKYKIRLSHTPRRPGADQVYSSSGKGNWRTQYLFPPFPVIGPRNKNYHDGGAPGYVREGFLQLQHAIDSALISEYDPNVIGVDILLKRHPYPPYENDPFISVIQLLFPFIIMLSFIVTVILTAKSIVYEKETGIKESMRLMGMKTWIYWLSWYIKTLSLILPSVIFMVIAYKIKLPLPNGNYGAIIQHSDPILFALFLFLYVSSSIVFMFMCTTFFKKANSAAAGAGIIWFLSYLPFIFIQERYEEMDLFTKLIVMLINNIAMSEGMQLLGQLEGKGVGATFDNFTTGPSVDDNFAMVYVFVFLIINNFLYMLITLYVDSINPGHHGIAKPWYYPIEMFIPKRYCQVQSQSEDDMELKEVNNIETDNKKNAEDEIYLEDETAYSNRDIGVRILNLFKIFKQFGKIKAAVNNLNLNIYENQITVLLGHNGAGKSTTIAMITGLLKPDSGKILISGKDIVEETKEARKIIGFCPQHNLLFDDLTVYEHLKFFAKLKNDLDEKEIDNMLEIINLADKKHALSKTLSGGMKRKLSVAIAFIGKSKIVILDEPSSGMDPQARHSTWSLLQKFKKERQCTILLTTHFMDEADFLGDRIAIMSKGSLRCCGSPIYLKSKYSSGYNLVLTKSKKTEELNQAQNGVENEMDNRAINLVKSTIPDAKVNENLTSEISFILPAQQTSKFSELFQKLEEQKENINVGNIGISISTLEDVFLKINEYEDEEPEKPIKKNENSNSADINGKQVEIPVQKAETEFKEFGLWIGSDPSHLVYTIELILQQFMALLYKRWVHTIRNKVLTITQIMIPIGVMIIQLLYLKYAPLKPTDMPSLEIDLVQYTRNNVPYTIETYSGAQNQIDILNQLSSIFENHINSYSNSEAFDLSKKVMYSQCSNSSDTIDNYLACIGKLNIAYLVDNSVVSATIQESSRPLSLATIIGHFNNQGYHTQPLTVNLIMNTLFKYYANGNLPAGVEPKITVVNHPMPRSISEVITDFLQNDATSFNVASGLTFGFSFLIASFAVFIIKEKSTNSRHIQYLSGCSPLMYWTNAFVWDFISFLIPTTVVIILLWAFNVEGYIEDGRWVYTFFLLFIYGLAHTPQIYLLSFLFKVSATGLAALTAWNVVSSQATFTPANILQLPQLNLTEVGQALETVFVIFFPNFSVGQGLVNLYVNKQILDLCEVAEPLCPVTPNPCCKYSNAGMTKPCGDFDCLEWTRNILSWDRRGILKFYIFMLAQFIVQFAVLIIYDYGIIRKIFYSLKKDSPKVEEIDKQLEMEREYGDIRKDEDVINEEMRISELVKSGEYKNSSTKEIFIVDRITKHYSGFMAVKGISFALEQSECFGLLGVNGAGKTTTFKMITGDEMITRGDAYLNRVDLKRNKKNFQKQIGYCPQFDPLIDQMTVYETMRMYAFLRGIKKDLIQKTCLSLISLLDLDDHIYKMCGTLSGGNKRKLSVAIALVGSPSIVLLDEPTSGMDPKTRRGLWNCLNMIRNKGKSLILTTHGMDETEVLCTNIGIMVNGELKCLGSLQHLKSKYGEGYTLLAKIKMTDNRNDENQEKINTFISFILERFQPSIVKESRDGFVNIHISDNSISLLSKLFSTIENKKEEFSIEYYVVTQTKLEQIFLNFASKQIDPETRVVKRKTFENICCCSSSSNKSAKEPDIIRV